MTPIEERVNGILQRIKQFYKIEIEFHHKIYDNTDYIKHHCHNSECFNWDWDKYEKERPRFKGNCNCEEYCHCHETVRYSWVKYELDFFIIYNKKSFCVECDGKEFHTGCHEKYDEERDNYILKVYKIPTLRLDGSFIYSGTDKAILSRLTKFILNNDKSNEILKMENEPAKRLLL